MAFTDLHEHIQQQFAELAGYDEYDAQLTLWAYRQRQVASERTMAADNPEQRRERQRRYDARRTRDWNTINAARWALRVASTKRCRRCDDAPAPDSVLCPAHKEWQRKNKQAKRQEARAA